MKIKEIYQKFDNIGSVVFATVDGEYPETRIAHFFGYDEQGLYFRTMHTKPFYDQLHDKKKISVCGLYASPKVKHDEDGMPLFEPGYTVRVTGDIKEVPFEYVAKKAKTDKNFLMCLKDINKYPATRAFVLYQGRGEIFDYDFEKENRNHKLLRTQFTFNDFEYPNRGLVINDKCVNCGLCFKVCSFDAISKGEDHYHIDKLKCDMCGDCTIACKFDAIEVLIK